MNKEFIMDLVEEWDVIFSYIKENDSWSSFKERLTYEKFKELHSIIKVVLENEKIFKGSSGS